MRCKKRQENDPRPLFSILVITTVLLGACGPRSIPQALDDATITARVKTVLLNDPQVGATKIDVDTANGVVTMSGTVKSTAEEQRALALARQVSGVKEVRSSLQVSGP
jgi:hyperosmotically inducible protein